MNHSKIAAWMGSVLETRDEELSCSECFDQLAAYVEDELGNPGEPDAYALLKQHLGQCRVCREEYQVLRELTREEPPG